MGDTGFFKANADRSAKTQAARLDSAINAESEQEQIPEPKKKKQNRTRGIVSLTLSPEEHEKLKTYAKERGATVSGIISLWIRQNCD